MFSEITLNPVGSIKMDKGRYYISIRDEYKMALKELDGFSHINIIWWGNKSDSPEKRKEVLLNKPYKKGPDSIGVFATRSEVRPNPVLITAVAIININHEEGIIEIPWIDADNDTPVIDIKPYHPCSDKITNVQLPDWCSEWPQCYEDSAEFDWESVFNF